jgi:hypothetical protein
MSTISRASSNKGTFFPHKMLKESDIISEVFTNGLSDRINRNDFVPDRHSFFAETFKQENYLKTNLEEFENVSNTKTNFDKPHAEIMQSITNSAAFFVGLAPYDTFTITSLEALSKGIPLLVRSKNNFHPAMEMIEDEFNQYIYCFKTKSDFVEKIREFSNITLEERQNLANSCYIKMNRNEFKKKWDYAIENTVKKYYDTGTETTLKEFCEDNIDNSI